jgi:hypothetical protein
MGEFIKKGEESETDKPHNASKPNHGRIYKERRGE